MTKDEFEKYLEKDRQAKRDPNTAWVFDSSICGVSVYDDDSYEIEVLSGYLDNPISIERAKGNAKAQGRKIVRFENYYYGRLVSITYPD